jgi:hypothetical protein
MEPAVAGDLDLTLQNRRLASSAASATIRLLLIEN